MVLPIKRTGVIVGTFNLYSMELNFSGPEEIKLLVEVTDDISFALDIFEKDKKQAITEALVLKNERRFRALVENGTDAVAIFSSEGNIDYISPSVEKMLGYTEEEVMKLGLFSLVYPDDVEELAKVWRHVLLSPGIPIPGYTGRLLHKDGTWRWIEAVATNMLNDPAINGIVDNFRDVTERVNSEEQKIFDRNNLDALINNTNDLMWSVDLNFKLITSNEPFGTILKLSGKSIQRGGDILSGAFSAEQSDWFKSCYERAFKGETFTEFEYHELPEEYWMEISFCPIRKNNEVIGSACHSRNITEKRKAEQQLVQHSKNLEQFASIVSHNLRAPVANILGIANVLKKDISSKDRKRSQEFLFKATEQLDEVLRDMVKILQARSEINKYKERVDLNELVEVIKSSINNIIEKEMVEITTDFKAVASVSTIKSYIHSIFYNLISNSIKYRLPGENPLLHIKSILHKGRLRISFKDNGSGLDLAMHGDKIFGLYKRFHLNIEGKGLGLFMVKTQIETLGGTIEVFSKEGEGAEFIIELPT